MRKLLAVPIIISAVVLAGCSVEGDGSSPPLYETTIVLNDGGLVTCVTYEWGKSAGGASCNWEKHNADNGVK